MADLEYFLLILCRVSCLLFIAPFYSMRGTNIIYVDQVGFYEWNGKIWSKISDSHVRNYADKLYGKRFATAQRVASVCNLLKSRSITQVIFDRNPVLTFQNGTLEIETGKFRDFSEADYCSICMDYDYDASARCPTWEHFIEDVTDEEPRRAEILQFIAGYVLFPDCRHQIGRASCRERVSMLV